MNGFAGTDRNNFLDCLRAIAAFLVLACHAGLLLGGAIGVSVFFCLSGFLIATILLRIEAPLPPSLGKFVFRRFMRIWPMMLVQIVSTAVLLAAVVPDNLPDYLSSVPGLLTFTSRIDLPYMLSRSVLWTLQAEFWFYILMAALVLAAGRAAVPWFAVFGIGLAWCAKLGLVGIPLAFPARNTVMYMDQLMIGVLCASAVHGNARLVTAFFQSRALWLWFPFAAIMILSTLRFRGYDLPWHLASSATAYLTAAMILHQSARPLTGDYEPLAALGRISYSIYLMHAVIFDFVSWHLFPPALQCLFEIGLAVLVAMATCRWIEMPLIRWSRQAALPAAIELSSQQAP
jgi:peptidoglycan/LPS O-acetylase OafA/YrhL